jgi:arabinose-5-phosphate isomerase
MMKLTRIEIQEIARNTLQSEADAILQLKEYVDDDFYTSVDLIYQCEGRVIVTGIGKSAIIGQKIVATLNSTGTPAIFIHAADAVHGDLGAIRKDDVIVCISNSGNTAEIKVLVPFLKLSGNKLIAMTGHRDSYLGLHADLIINTTVAHEACPNNLAPTSSTTAQLAMGDALAVCLLEYRGFTVRDFAMVHPGGALGKKLFLRVTDLYVNNEKPLVQHDTSVHDAIIEISSKRLGATAVMHNGQLAGIITDGDLRRMIQQGKTADNLKAQDIMSRNPKTVEAEILVAHALDIMRSNNITQLIVTDKGKYVGIIHLHDILKEGIL